MSQLQEIFERAIKPISDDSPCGENAKHDEQFSKVKSEVMKLTAGTADVDWDGIIADCDELLTNKTKDLTLVAYLVLALSKVHDYPGLETGLKILEHYIENFWEDMFPPARRQRARSQLFEWINERVSVILSSIKPNPAHADIVRACSEMISELPEKAQRVLKAPVGFGPIRAEVAKCLDKMPAPKPKEEPKPEPKPAAAEAQTEEKKEEEKPAEATPAPAPAAAPQAAPAAEAMEAPATPSEIGSIKEGLNAIAKVVNLIREAQPDAPVAYQLARAAKWGAIDSLPPAGADGKTRIPAPRDQELTMFEMQLNGKKWQILLETAESRFLTVGTWTYNMNIQRCCYLALQGIGANDAAEVVMLETGRFLQRFPEIVDLSYSTGLEFADGATRAWCEEAVAKASPGKAADDSEDNEWINEAKSIAQKKNVVQALEIVQDAINGATNKKEALKRQLLGAKLCVSHNSYPWAIPILESLNEQIQNMTLAQWEPTFCAEVWDNLLKGYNATKKNKTGDKEEIERQDQIRRKLYEVDLVKAVSVTPKK